jgi:hypothetical protein
MPAPLLDMRINILYWSRYFYPVCTLMVMLFWLASILHFLSQNGFRNWRFCLLVMISPLLYFGWDICCTLVELTFGERGEEFIQRFMTGI